MNLRYNFRPLFIVPNLYPMVCTAYTLIAGIWWQTQTPSWQLTASLTLCTLACGCLLTIKRPEHRKAILFYAGIFVTGVFITAHQTYRQENFLSHVHDKKYHVTGTVSDIAKTGNPRNPYKLHIKIQTLEQVESNKFADKITESHNNFGSGAHVCFYLNKLTGIRVADTIQFKNIRFCMPPNTNFAHYMLKESVLASAFLYNPVIERKHRPQFSITRWINEYRYHMTRQLYFSMDDQTYKAYASIFLGNPHAKKQENVLKDKLRTWGLFHYIARAGLHLAIFISIWVFLLGRIPISWAWRNIFIILLSFIYFLFSWPSIPFNRAFFTFIFVRLCTLMRMRTYYVPALACITVYTLAINPIQLLSLDFQLSFGITYALALFNEIRHRRR